MAGNYTQHYQLSQWQPQDRVLRTEFNQDNAKLDGALHTLAQLAEEVRSACPLVKLKEFTVSASQNEVTLDVSGLDLTQYLELLIYLSPGAATTAKVVYLAVNDETRYYDYNDTAEALAMVNLNSSGPADSFCRFRVTLEGYLAGEGAYTYLNDDSCDEGVRGPYACPVKAAQVEKFRLWAYQTLIGAGSWIRIYGVKK